MLNLISVISDLFAEFVDDISICYMNCIIHLIHITLIIQLLTSYLFTKYMSPVPTEKEM